MTTGVIVWWAASLGMACLLAADSPILWLVTAVSATACATLLLNRTPRSPGARWGVYLSSLLANNATFVAVAVQQLLQGEPTADRPATVSDLLLWICMATLAAATFLLVRVWVSYGERRRLLLRPALERGRAVGLGAMAAAVFMIGSYASDKVWELGALLLDVSQTTGPVESGQFSDWLVMAASSGLAGAIEEPVFAGLVVLLWPAALRKGHFLRLALISGLARSMIHLYYVGGAAPLLAAIVLVVVWCVIWSSVSLFLVYRTRMLWPMVAAHGLYNVAITTYDDKFDFGENVVTFAFYVLPALIVAAVFIVAVGYLFPGRTQWILRLIRGGGRHPTD